MIDSIPETEKGGHGFKCCLTVSVRFKGSIMPGTWGRVMEVMVEGANPARGQVIGRSSQNKPVNFTCAQPIAPAPGSYLQVKITGDASQQSGGRGSLRLERAKEGEAMDIEVRIRGLMMDPATNMPIVVLKDIASETVMPIWVGIFEANAIAIEIEKVAAPRPMTHDLTRNLIQHLNARLERVVITELKDDTFSRTPVAAAGG